VKDLRFSPFTGNVFAGRTYAEIGEKMPETKAISPEMSAWMRAEDVDATGTGATMTSPYSQSSWVYIAISRLAEKVSSIPFRVSRMDSGKAKKVRAFRNSADPRHRAMVRKALGETIIESGAVVDLFNQPHPTMNRQLFWEMVVTWNCLRGEFFIVPLDKNDQPVDLAMSAPRVERMLTLPTELFWHVVMGYELTGWRYTGSPLVSPLPSEMLLPSEVVHARTPNPFLYWRGMSPLIVAMLPAGADFAAAKYNQGYWLNNADTGLIVTTEQQATAEQRAAILAALRERKRKAGTADRPMFLWGGAKVEKPTLSGMEQQMIENRKMNRQEILAVFKVTDSFIGLTDGKSSALSGGGGAINQEEIKVVEGTIVPLCEHIEAAVDPIVRSFGEGLMGWFDIDGLPIMQEARRARLDSAVKAFGIGAAFNDINRVYDLGFPEYKWGSKSYLPFNLIEAGTSPDMPGEEDNAEPTDEEKEKANPFARMQRLLSVMGKEKGKRADTKLIWERHILSRRKAVKQMQSKVSKVLLQFRGTTLEKLSAMQIGKALGETKGLIDLIFNAGEFGKKLKEELKNPIMGTLQLAGDELMSELGLDDPWKMPPAKAQDYLGKRDQEIQGVGGTVRNRLNTSLQEGLDGGETMDELSDRVRGVFNEMSEGEARRVAMTETNMAYNHARHEAMGDAGIPYKAWLSSHGPTVREAHAQAEQTYIDNPIPVGDPFTVMGEQLMYPGDTSLGASAANIINCQCIQLAATKTDEDETTLTFDIAGVGEMKFAKR
jgi:phage portal protein BeeE